MKRAWGYAYKFIPHLCKEAEWMELLQICITGAIIPKKGFPTSKEVCVDKRLPDGLKIGPFDKNNGELWMCCPHKYDKALNKAYTNGYEKVNPSNLNASQSPTHTSWQQKWLATQRKRIQDRRMTLFLKLWRQIYMEKGWNKFATFNKRGGFKNRMCL